MSRPYQSLDEGSDPTIKGADFIKQDGLIFCWSESNVAYEYAWWLDPTIDETPLVKHLREVRAPLSLGD